MTGGPIFSKVYPLPRLKLAVAREKFEKLFAQDIYSPSESGWSLPVRMVLKRNDLMVIAYV